MSTGKVKTIRPPKIIVLPPDALKAFENETKPETGESYFSFRGVQYVSTISPKAIEAGPTWSPSQHIPLAPDHAITAARAVLRKLVKEDSTWPITEITIQRLRNSNPERWFFVVQFTRETGPAHLQGVAQIYVDFRGRVGTVKKVKMT